MTPSTIATRPERPTAAGGSDRVTVGASSVAACGPRPSGSRNMPIEGYITLGIVVACVVFTFVQFGPGNILSNTTPAGGDMGAHVWGPAYLRDNLLPQGRLTGWTPDWYAGFPAYQFYMVLPSLLIALLSYVIPYGVAFKLVAISGVLTLPIAAYAFGRLTRLPFPIPPLLAVAATMYLFDRSFSILGGNIASTLAGEFAFSMALSLALLYLGVVGRGLESGKYRGLGGGAARRHRVVSSDPAVLRVGRHGGVVPALPELVAAVGSHSRVPRTRVGGARRPA